MLLKNKKAGIISLEVLIGVVIAIVILVSATTIISRFFRLSDSSKDSFNQLVALIEEVNQDNHATRKSMPLRMDEDTAIIGFLKNKESVIDSGKIDTSKYGIYDVKNVFNKPSNCGKDKACICLCRKPILPKDSDSRTFMCEDKNLICKTLDGLDFVGEGFIISRSEMPDILTIRSSLISTEDMSQFRVISVEKYSEYGEELIAVCETLEEGSCVSKEYREEKKAIFSLKKLKEFIESCKDREFREFVDIENSEPDNPEPCSCGVFDSESEIPEGYDIELSESNEEKLPELNKKLKLVLKKGEESIGEPLIVNTNFCEYSEDKLRSSGNEKLSFETKETPKNPINLDEYIKLKYTIRHTTEILLKPLQIAFIKYDKENICLAYNNPSYEKTDTNPDTIAIKYYKQQNEFPIIEIPGCKGSYTITGR